ncbi:solute carrier family 35 member F5 [Hermetia illucens]|uniref:solute carrier family 35 member F5 n=1 Tax=Hermetia illucens TaxID=343691 RepID=UPI0018CC79F4|nr:solute carrier family 35 member F5 [Hermetia illucens]XP_037920639.1 solute carrier family 35 member F5 [Hermetia illucens]
MHSVDHNMFKKSYKICFGVLLLIILDVFCVLAEKVRKYVLKDDNCNKPFFSAYTEVSMFALYLLVIGIIEPLRETCTRNKNYSIMEMTREDENYTPNYNRLSDSSFVPIQSDALSSTESDDSTIRSVRFSKLAEVREMSSVDASEALMSRLSYSASLRLRKQKTHHQTAKAALLYSILYFIGKYSHHTSINSTETPIVTAFSSTSSLFTLILASMFPSTNSDKFSFSKLIAVLINMSGIVLVTVAHDSAFIFSRECMLSLLNAFFTSLALVYILAKNIIEDKFDIPLFLGFVGLWNLILMWPLFFVLDLLQIESFLLPSERQLIIIFLNGLFGTVLSETFRLWGCLLTSSVLGVVVLSMQIPFSVLFELLFTQSKINVFPLCIGSITVLLAVIFLAILTKYGDVDPLLKIIKVLYKKVIDRKRANSVKLLDYEEQHESLIDVNQ